MEWEPVIGLEVHAQLATHSKIFSGAATAYGAEPNTQACLIDLGYPGVLPVLNEQAVRMALKFGLAIHAEIAPYCVFARKNYFYPDLPKGYQISQYESPIVGKGYIDVLLEDSSSKRVNITRAHLEEDAGKSLHGYVDHCSGIDLNRAGTPLLEIVSEPEIYSASEAVAYLKALHSLVRYLDICDGNMQEGSFRCDANVSVRPKGAPLGTRTEIKNVNSFRFVEKAILYEIARQIARLEQGEVVLQETRLYDANRNETRAMRSKEEANDYRYFPDPDLLPVHVSQSLLEEVAAKLPELPQAKSQRLQAQYELSAYDANVIVSTKELADYFEQLVAQTQASAKLAANWLTGELAAALNKHNLTITDSPISHRQLAQLLDRIHDHTISGKIAKTVFEAMWAQEGEADHIIESKGLRQVTDTGAIAAIIDDIIANNPQQVAQYQAGKDKLFGFFVGQVMKQTQGKANPQQVNDLLREKLGGTL